MFYPYSPTPLPDQRRKVKRLHKLWNTNHGHTVAHNTKMTWKMRDHFRCITHMQLSPPVFLETIMLFRSWTAEKKERLSVVLVEPRSIDVGVSVVWLPRTCSTHNGKHKHKKQNNKQIIVRGVIIALQTAKIIHAPTATTACCVRTWCF